MTKAKTKVKTKVKAHVSSRTCPICTKEHTTNEHRFHGKGTYKKTHEGTKKQKK